MMLKFVIYAICLGFFIAIIILTVQFTVANIGAIVVCIILMAIIYGLYQLFKPIPQSQKQISAPMPKLVQKPVKKPKPMSPEWRKAWSLAGATIAWVLVWSYLELLIYLYIEPVKKLPLFARILLCMLPHILIILSIIRKRLKPLKTPHKKRREFARLLADFARVCACIVIITAICLGIWAVSFIIITISNNY